MFFWMQEPKDNKDEEFCQKVNDFLNYFPVFTANDTVSESNSTTTASMPTGSTQMAPTTEAGNVELTSQSLPQDGTGAVQLSDLQSFLSGIIVPEIKKEPPVDLAFGIIGETVAPLLTNPEFVAKMKSHLPKVEGADVAGEISSTISSPQFQQNLQLFCTGLQSGQLAPLIREFNLGDSAIAAATSGDMKAFIKAIQEKMQKQNVATEQDGEDVNMTDA